LKVGGFANWLDARYGEYTAIIGNVQAPATDQQMVQAPEWKFGLFVDYRYELAGGGAIFAFSDATWQDDTKFAPSFNTLAGNVDPVLADALTQQAYTVVNARLGYESSGGWRVAAFARNALDEEYYVSGDATPFPGYAGQPGVPLVYGVELTLDF
jgi:outer membrane receptor protein involved in Fe transport